MQTNHDRPPRVESLTGLRWFAAFGVFAFHANQILPLPVIGEVLRFGDAGVTFFYVLSGFVLTWSFSPTVGLRTFWWRRFARVWPMLPLSLLIAWFCFHQTFSGSWKQSVLGLTLLESWTHPPAHLIANPVSWSVSCEAFFYLLFPFLVRPVLRLERRGLALLAGILLVFEWAYWYIALDFVPAGDDYWVVLSWLVRFPPYRLTEFVLGMVVAAALLRGWRPRLPLWAGLAAVPLSIAIMIAGNRIGWWQDVWSQQGMLAACAVVVISAALRDIDGRPSFLRSRPMVALGKWSYAFYLVHLSVIYLFIDLANRENPVSRANVLALAVWAVAATILAALCYHLFEHPVETWLRRLYPRRDAPSTRVPAARTAEPVPTPVDPSPAQP